MDVNQCVCVEWGEGGGGGFQAFCREMLRYTLVHAIPISAKSKNPLYLTKGTVPAFIQKTLSYTQNRQFRIFFIPQVANLPPIGIPVTSKSTPSGQIMSSTPPPVL